VLYPFQIPITEKNCWTKQLGPYFTGVLGEATGSPDIPYNNKENWRTVHLFLQDKDSIYSFPPHFGAQFQQGQRPKHSVFSECSAASRYLLLGFPNQSCSTCAPMTWLPSGSIIFHECSPFGSSSSFCFTESKKRNLPALGPSCVLSEH